MNCFCCLKPSPQIDGNIGNAKKSTLKKSEYDLVNHQYQSDVFELNHLAGLSSTSNGVSFSDGYSDQRRTILSQPSTKDKIINKNVSV